MDNKDQQPINWAWVAQAMPALPARIKELRERYGNAHVNECWRRGVVRGEPEWFFARQGVVALGTPFGEDPVIANFAAQAVAAGACLVVIREPGAPNGTH